MLFGKNITTIFINSITTFIRYNKRWSLQALLFISFTSYIVIKNLLFHLNNNEYSSYALARTFGKVIKIILMPSIIMPICRVIFTSIRHSYISKFVGLDRRIIDHQIFATICSICALMHILSHYIYNPANFYKQTGITGIIMVLSLIFPLFSVFFLRSFFNFFQKYSYNAQVLRPHQLGSLIFIIAYAFHAPDKRLLMYSIIMYAIYLLDRFIEKVKYKHLTKITYANIITNTDYIVLRIEKPPSFGRTLPGQYALLSFPDIDSQLECYHPFTIVNDNYSILTFIIKKTGRWTTEFYELILNGRTCTGSNITVIGPYGSSLDNLYKQPSVTFITTGIGLTPLVSFLNYSIHNNYKLPRLDIHCCQKNIQYFLPLIETCNNITIYDKQKINIHIYITQNYDNIPKIPDSINIYFHRPNLGQIIKSSEFVAVCGNKNIVDNVYLLCLRYCKNCYIETF